MGEALNCIQKHDKLNNVYRSGDVGPGGAYHTYEIVPNKNGTYEPAEVFTIQFQRGPRLSPDSTLGILDTDLMEIVRDRLLSFQRGEYATRDNAMALTHIEEALLWMNKRVEDRAERGVLGTTSV
jgi:hypothetical protein